MSGWMTHLATTPAESIVSYIYFPPQTPPSHHHKTTPTSYHHKATPTPLHRNRNDAPSLSIKSDTPLHCGTMIEGDKTTQPLMQYNNFSASLRHHLMVRRTGVLLYSGVFRRLFIGFSRGVDSTGFGTPSNAGICVYSFILEKMYRTLRFRIGCAYHMSLLLSQGPCVCASLESRDSRCRSRTQCSILIKLCSSPILLQPWHKLEHPGGEIISGRK
ncbi:hypothetical protein BCR34DRAFT_392866 [Clohesyomyces aquaticus]|uniref:Uncharacterized protein n=1 Tax=Clohesyomyces aquaticus TaxID=1231657 RepID=A0A1Y1ZEB0_9PLEO|nr:hypothetical protein BCR34DRAFT_392866 [Clohesyomyces aquaticus]